MKTYRPAQSAGNLYYVRLKTPVGPLYKLGYTTMKSAQERFAFQGENHEALIDQVLFFGYFDDAFDLEDQLHQHFRSQAAFSKKYPQAHGPLYKNGQSELYSEDILGLDSQYASEQSERTKQNLKIASYQSQGLSVESVQKSLDHGKLIQQVIEVVVTPLVWLILPITWLWMKVFGDENAHKQEVDRNKARTAREAQARQEFLEHSLQRIRQTMLAQERRDFRESTQHDARDYQLIQATRQLEQQTCVTNLKIAARERELMDQARRAIAAIKTNDLALFEELVDINLLCFNLAEAMTSHLMMGSDYLIVANNTGMMNLMDAMMAPDAPARDLLLKPVENTYRTVLRHFVHTHAILTESILVPPGPLYEIDRSIGGSSDADGSDEGLGLYFGLGSHLDDLGRDVTLPDSPEFIFVEGALQAALHFRHTKRDFQGDLVLEIRMTTSGALAVDFPNFRELKELALEADTDYQAAIAHLSAR
jgi:hypothetical protein